MVCMPLNQTKLNPHVLKLFKLSGKIQMFVDILLSFIFTLWSVGMPKSARRQFFFLLIKIRSDLLASITIIL